MKSLYWRYGGADAGRSLCRGVREEGGHEEVARRRRSSGGEIRSPGPGSAEAWRGGGTQVVRRT